MLFSSARKKRIEVQRFILRVVNRNCPDARQDDGRPRADRRVNLSLPAWLVPLDNGRPDLVRAFVTVTREFSAVGLSLAVNRPVASEEVVVGLEQEGQPVFLRAAVRHVDPLGAGLSHLGVQFLEILDPQDYPELAALHF